MKKETKELINHARRVVAQAEAERKTGVSNLSEHLIDAINALKEAIDEVEEEAGWEGGW